MREQVRVLRQAQARHQVQAQALLRERRPVRVLRQAQALLRAVRLEEEEWRVPGEEVVVREPPLPTETRPTKSTPILPVSSFLVFSQFSRSSCTQAADARRHFGWSLCFRSAEGSLAFYHPRPNSENSRTADFRRLLLHVVPATWHLYPITHERYRPRLT